MIVLTLCCCSGEMGISSNRTIFPFKLCNSCVCR
nr:ALPV-087 [Albatrosspox virus]